jgi:hypothetical protein
LESPEYLSTEKIQKKVDDIVVQPFEKARAEPA